RLSLEPGESRPDIPFQRSPGWSTIPGRDATIRWHARWRRTGARLRDDDAGAAVRVAPDSRRRDSAPHRSDHRLRIQEPPARDVPTKGKCGCRWAHILRRELA